MCAAQPFEAVCGAIWPSKRRDPSLATRGWELWKKGSGAPDDARSFTNHINYPKRLSAIPNVFIGLHAIDLLIDGPLCIFTSANNVSNQGMDIQFITRNDACVWSAGLSWFAYVPHRGGPELRTGSVQCHSGCPGYNLNTESYQPGARTFSYMVPFAEPFNPGLPAPTIICAISGFTAPPRSSQGAIPLRVRVYPTEIGYDRFKLNVTTWDQSMINDITVSWLAYSVDPSSPYSRCIVSRTVPCMNSAPDFKVNAGSGPRDYIQKITFGPQPFPDVPSVLTFLSGFEVFTRSDVRLKAVEKARTNNGCDLDFGTWANTLVGGGDFTWFAFLDTLPAAAAAPGIRDISGRRYVQNNPAPAAHAAPAPPPAEGSGLECSICMERNKNTLMLPCGHICCCGECAARLPSPKICPLCRTPIASMQTVYLA